MSEKESSVKVVDLPAKNEYLSMVTQFHRDLPHTIGYYEDRAILTARFFKKLLEEGLEPEAAVEITVGEFSD